MKDRSPFSSVPAAIKTILALSLYFCMTSPAFTLQKSPDVLRLESFLNVDKIKPGEKFKVGLQVTLLNDWHINSNKPSDELLIPTLVEFDSVAFLSFADVEYPAGEMLKFDFSETPLSVYDGTVLITAEVQAAEQLQAGDIVIKGIFSYQACNDLTCLMPAKQNFLIEVPVAGPDDIVMPVNTERFAATAFQLGELQGVRESAENEIDRLVQGKGLFVALLIIFVGGLALNLTPCVYPIIPITISFFVGQASGQMGKSFVLAAVYVLGMAITYSTLGVIAALTGGLLGASLQNPMVLVGIAAIFLLFAASMFGAFEIRVPTFLASFAGGSKQGLWGSLFMGLTVGIVAAPCIGPFVISLLTYVAGKADPVAGFVLFFVLSMGLGLPYLLLGTFSGSIKNLPRSGEWMVWIKKVFGVIMIAIAVYFVSTLLPGALYYAILTIVLAIGGLAVGFFDKSRASFAWFPALKKITGIALLVLGFWLAGSAWTESRRESIAWQPFEYALLESAQQQGKPVLVDFYADWCIPCKQIETKLFKDAEIVALSGKFTALKADLTEEGSRFNQDLRLQYEVLGVPTIILIDDKGREYRRFTDELVKMAPADFAEIMRQAFTSDTNTNTH